MMDTCTEYSEFIHNKICQVETNGLPCGLEEIHPILKPHQRDIVQWAVRGGRRAIFEAFGLGKSLQQLEICRLIHKKTGCRTLIVCPLGVRKEFMRDAEMIGVALKFVRRTEEVTDDYKHFITNYESVRDGKLEPSLFDCVTLDESSVLRTLVTKTFTEFFKLLRGTRYKYVATATPNPNRIKELTHYSEFLGIMDSDDAVTRFFKRDRVKAHNLTLQENCKKDFWAWFHSWAAYLQKPSEMGYSDEGYDLPPLNVLYHEVSSSGVKMKDRDGQNLLFNDSSMSLIAASREKRGSIKTRVEKARELVRNIRRDDLQNARSLSHDDSGLSDQIIIWADLNDEQAAVERMLREEGITYTSLYGNDDIDDRDAAITLWKEKKTSVFLSKPEMYGSGVNMQQCHTMIFVGIGFKFQDFSQAIHRIYRFLQVSRCDIHIIYTEAERGILDVLRRKWAEYDEMQKIMSDIVAEYGLSDVSTETLTRTSVINRKVVKGKTFEVVNNDCVTETQAMEENSVDLILTSIPFGNQYSYCSNYYDFGYTESNDKFWKQMDFLSPHLLRVLKPGRVACIHVKDRILPGQYEGTGCPTVDPFHADAIYHYRKHGFFFMGMITVVTDVVRENNQTYRLGWSENCKDGTKMGVGMPEYVLIFRKPQTDLSRGYADEPVIKDKSSYSRARWQIDAHGFWRDAGDRLMTADELTSLDLRGMMRKFTEYSQTHVYDYEEHVATGAALEEKGKLPKLFMAIAPASPDPNVWADIPRVVTLNTRQKQKGLNAHCCPLQIKLVERLIIRYSNEGDTVYDPFGGIMTVPYCAIRMNRRGIACELNYEYFRDGLRYLEQAEQERKTRTLFDDADEEAG